MKTSLITSTISTLSLPAALLAICLWPLPLSAQGNPLGTLIFESTLQPTIAPASGEPNGVAAEDTLTTASADNIEADGTSSIDTGAAIRDYLAVISDTIEQGNTYSQGLAEQYEALGILLYQSGDYDAAIAAFEDAIHIQKVNKGLFSLDQARLVERLISTHVARGDFIAVDNHKHYLYYLQEKNLTDTDPRLVAARLDWADWNVEAYIKGYRESFSYPVNLSDSVRTAQGYQNRVQVDVPVRRNVPVDGSLSTPNAPTTETVTDTVPVTISVPFLNSNSVVTNAAVTDYNLRSIPFALSNDMVVNQRLHEAESLYETILEQADTEQGLPLADQETLHLKLANINYLLKKELEKYETVNDRGSIAYNRVNNEYTSDASMMADRRYLHTKNAYTDLVEEIEQSKDSTVEDKAGAYISLGDMHLSFDRPKRAFDAYQKANEILVSAGFTSARSQAMLSPVPDLAVPAYGTHNFSREFFGIAPETDIPWRGHIDVEFSKNRFGTASGVKVLASSAETPAQVQSALANYLRNQRFRPALVNGEAVEQNNIRLRYYYYY